nr:hypothetical protein [Tanacetum cinerariifolium]
VAWSRSWILRALRRPDSLAAQFVLCPQGVPVFRCQGCASHRSVVLRRRGRQTDFYGSAVCTDLRRCEAAGPAGGFRRVHADPVGQLVRTPANENKTFETLGRLRQPWQSKQLRAISSTTCRT